MFRNKRFRNYYMLSLVGVLMASLWPLVRGAQIVRDMLIDGEVQSAFYPKYIIPYLPVALAVIVGVAMIPLWCRVCRRYALLAASGVSLGVFFASELVLENWVIVTDAVLTSTKLESWQMYMCYIPADLYETRTWRAVDVLIGEYSPWFKLHFYAISVVLILALLNSFYGFAQMILGGNRKRLRHLIVQSAAAALFLGLCLLACFTAFWRTGEILVSPLSASMMCIFFVIFGVTMGCFVGSLMTSCRRQVTLAVSALTAAAVTLLMYIGELILLHGHLYRFGNGPFFTSLGPLTLAPVDFCVILLSAAVTAGILHLISRNSSQQD